MKDNFVFFFAFPNTNQVIFRVQNKKIYFFIFSTPQNDIRSKLVSSTTF